MSPRSESDLVRLRKLALASARERREKVTTVHLLAAVCTFGGPARDLLAERRLDAKAVLSAARSFDEDGDDAIAGALSAARELAHRSAVPTRQSFVSSRRGAVRPAAAAEPGSLHLLVALLSNRRYAAFRALAQCGVDVGRLRMAATRVALGLVSPPRGVRAPDDLAGAKKRALGMARGLGPAMVVPLIPAAAAAPAADKVEAEPAQEPEPSSRRPRVVRAPAARIPTLDLDKTRRAPLALRGAAADEAVAELDAGEFPNLVALGHNLTLAALRGELEVVIGRERQVERALDVLAKRHGNCALLVGPAGVGKTAVAHAIATHFAEREDERRVLVELSVVELLAGTGARGALAERLASVRDEVRQSAGRVVVFIDEIHELLQSSAPEEVMVELKLALARGELPLVAATTSEHYRRHIESDPALARRFTPVEIDEPEGDQAHEVVAAVAAQLERHHRVRYQPEAVVASVSWSKRYLAGRALPDKAVSLLDLAGARAQRRDAAATEVLAADVAEVMAELCDVPIERLLEGDRERMLRLDELLREHIVGHPEACDRVAAVLRRNAAGLTAARPLGTFLLLGPTGVGKTEMAKAVARVLFHAPDAMTRLDMSEYAEAHAVARLIGAPPGYVGHESGGMLTEAVRRRPYQVVLLDEIEKAHRDVLQAFLQVFDEGRLTDGRGRTVDFTSAVIILTSNLGARELGDALGERRVGFAGQGRTPPRGLAEVAVRAARAALPPELYNRIDEVLFFEPLGRAEVRAIAERLLAALGASLSQQGIGLEVQDAALDALLELGGFDAELGARPMRRAVARRVEAPLADMILGGQLEAGSTAVVTVRDRELIVVPCAPQSSCAN
jgi:ATP-dependent Clp protease ATP-binding subunit ClpC